MGQCVRTPITNHRNNTQMYNNSLGTMRFDLFNMHKNKRFDLSKMTVNRQNLTKMEHSYGEMLKNRSADLLIFLDKTPFV